jgi:hypothetical protein
MGYYPDKRIYKAWKFVQKQLQGWQLTWLG